MKLTIDLTAEEVRAYSEALDWATAEASHQCKRTSAWAERKDWQPGRRYAATLAVRASQLCDLNVVILRALAQREMEGAGG